MKSLFSRLTATFLMLALGAVPAPLFAAADEAKSDSVNTVPESKNQIIKLTNEGVSPEVLTMKREDSIVFFLNQTKNALTTVEIDFGDKHTHCSSGNLSIIDGGTISSVKPFGPDDFSSTCFHDPGSYTYKVFGLPKKPEGISGKIIVE